MIPPNQVSSVTLPLVSNVTVQLLTWLAPTLRQSEISKQHLQSFLLQIASPSLLLSSAFMSSSALLTSMAHQDGGSISNMSFTVSAINATTLLYQLAFDNVSDHSTRRNFQIVLVDVFACASVAVGLNFTVENDLDAGTKASTSQTAATTATAIGSVVAAASLSPTAAAQMARLGAMQSISACVFTNDDAPITFSGGSYTSLVVGSTPGMYLRGAVIGNLLIVIVGSIVLLVVIVVWSVFERVKIRIASVHTQQSSVAAEGEKTIMQTFGRAAEVGRVPSVYYPVFAVFAPPTVGFAITLLSISPLSPENASIAVATSLVSVLYATAVTRNLYSHRSCLELGLVKLPRGITNRQSMFMLLCLPKQRWLVSSQNNSNMRVHDAWRKRNRLLFDDFDRWWYGLIDLWSSVVVGIVNGVQVSSREVCAAQIAVMLLIFLTVFCLGVYLDPCMSRSLRYYLNVSNAMGLLSSCMLVAAIRTDSQFLLDLSNWSMVALSVVSLAKLLIDIMYVLYRFARSMDAAFGELPRRRGVVAEGGVLVVSDDRQVGDSDHQAKSSHGTSDEALEMALLQPSGDLRREENFSDASTTSPIDLETLLGPGNNTSFTGTAAELDIRTELKPTSLAKRRRDGEFDVFGLAGDEEEGDGDDLLRLVVPLRESPHAHVVDDGVSAHFEL